MPIVRHFNPGKHICRHDDLRPKRPRSQEQPAIRTRTAVRCVPTACAYRALSSRLRRRQEERGQWLRNAGRWSRRLRGVNRTSNTRFFAAALPTHRFRALFQDIVRISCRSNTSFFTPTAIGFQYFSRNRATLLNDKMGEIERPIMAPDLPHCKRLDDVTV